MNIEYHQSRWRAVVAVAVTALVAVIVAGAARADAPAAAPGPALMGPVLPGRPLASRVGEPSAVTELQARLDALSAAAGISDCDTQYQSYKAQAWLNFAKYAVQNEVPAPVQAAALRNAADIVGGLQSHSTPSMQTLELPRSRHERDDLWRAVKAMKADGRLCAAPKMTAYCEVQLAWVGYEATAGGWRHVDPYLRIAEDYCATASNAVPLPAAIVAARASAGAPAVEAAAAPVEIAPAEKLAEDINVSIYVLFPHDRSRRADIRPPGRLELAQLAAHLKALPEGTMIAVIGHTDITGRAHYNAALSQRRAHTVAQELQLQGVEPARIRISAVGSAEPVVSCPQARSRARLQRYLKCLEPNRRVVIHLVGE